MDRFSGAREMEGPSTAHKKEELLFHRGNRRPRNRGEDRTRDLKFKLNLWHHRSQGSPWAKKALSYSPGVIGIHHRSILSGKGKKKTCFEMTLKPALKSRAWDLSDTAE